MPFTIYPDAATSALLGTAVNTPVPLGAGVAMTNFAPLAAISGPDPTEFNLLTSFIRISMSDPGSLTPPQVALMAGNPAAGTTGAPQVIDPATNTSLTSGKDLADSSSMMNTPAASAYWSPPSYANNVYLLKVVLNRPNTSLAIKITNNTANPHDFVWVIADSDMNSQQPWMQLTPAMLVFAALVNQTSTDTARPIQITNRGTGQLAVTQETPAIATPYAVVSGLPATIIPNPAMPSTVMIGFGATATIGDTPPSTHTFDGDPGGVAGAGRNNQLALSASTGKLEIAMVLDGSGSMATAPDGSPTDAAHSRWSHLKSAAELFLSLLSPFGQNKGTIGIVKFPSQPGEAAETLPPYNLVPAGAIPASPADVMSAVGKFDNPGVSPFNSTPMDFGLQAVLTPAFAYFATDAASIQNNLRWMLLLSDGKWNEGEDPTTRIPKLASLKIKVFAVGFGTSGQVDYGTLMAISAATPGGMAQQVTANPAYDYNQLAHTFKQTIIAGLTSSHNAAADPKGILFSGQAEARHPVIITPNDTRAVFMITWNTPDAERMVLQLLTPNCELISAGNLRSFPGVTFSGALRHQLFTVAEPFLSNDADPTQPRYGTWRMIVSSPELSDGPAGPPPIGLRIASATVSAEAASEEVASEAYSYDVIVESSLRMEVELDQSAYFAGDPIGVSARLTQNGLPITHAAVRLQLTLPRLSMDNWLAAIPISDAEYKAAADALHGQDVSAIYIKAFAAKLKGISFDPQNQQLTIPMTDPDNRGVYAATIDATTTPDGHKIYVTAIGTTADGVVFRRERAVEVLLSVRPDPEFTLLDIRYDALQANPGLLSATVRVTPRDRFPNVMLIDPATSHDIQLSATGATLTGLTTTFDGSYTTGMTYPVGAHPTLSLVVRGVPVFQNRPVAPLDQLHYVDEVLDFDKGLEGAPGANQHADPNAALGDVRQKPDNVFTSLGGYGSLAVGFRDQLVLAQGDDDITVFVHPDDDARSYLLEARQSGTTGIWVPLGNSVGVTQSFGLKKSGLDSAAALRVTDTSGRTRGADFKPLPTPGVSIRGIGALRVGGPIPTLRATSISFLHISGRTEEGSVLPLPHGRQLNVHTNPLTHDDVNRILVAFDQPFRLDGIVADGRPQAAHLDGPIDGGSIVHFHSDLALAAGSHLIVQLTMKNPSSLTIPGTYRLTVFGRPAAGIVPLVAADGGRLNGDFLGTPGGSDLVVTFRVSRA